MATGIDHYRDLWLGPWPSQQAAQRLGQREVGGEKMQLPIPALRPSISIQLCCRLLITSFHNPSLSVPGAW